MPELTNREIDEYIEAHWGEVLSDIESLVAIESVEDLEAAAPGAPFGPGPRAALSKALEIAERMGLAVCDCEGHIGYADLQGQSDTQIGIIGHVDVVPAGPGWSVEPFALTRREGYLLGRGVIDDKGPIMVALHAVKFWKERGEELPYTVRLLFGANEETNMKDVAYYRERHDDPAFLFTPDNAFPVGYGESGICSGTLASAPIEDPLIVEIEGGQAVNAVPGHAHALLRTEAGSLPGAEGISLTQPAKGFVRVDAQGVSAHASTPELGDNAIGKLVAYLLDAGLGSQEERRFLELLDKLHGDPHASAMGIACADEHFGPLTAVGGVIGLKEGRICQSVDVRYPSTITAPEIAAALDAAAQQAGASFTLEHDKETFLMDPDSPAVCALLSAYNEATGEARKACTSKGGTYARCFKVGVSFGVEKPWEEGPEWLGGMHGPDEGVSEGLLRQALSIYIRTLGKLMDLEL